MIKMLISFVDGMFELKVFGFSEKLSYLLYVVLPKISSFLPTEDRYEVSCILVLIFFPMLMLILFIFVVLTMLYFFGQKNCCILTVNERSYGEKLNE